MNAQETIGIENAPSMYGDDTKKIEADFVENVERERGYTPEYLTYSAGQTVRVFWRAVLFCVLTGVGALFDGAVVSIPGLIIANAGFINQFGTITNAKGILELDALHVSAWGAVQSVGQIVGMYAGPVASDWMGRKFAMWIMTVSLVIMGTMPGRQSAVLEITAKEWGVFTAAKLFAGLGTGMIQAGLTVYIAEVAPSKIRGALLSMYSLFFAVGQLSATVGLNILAETAPLAYKRAFYAEFVFVAIFLPGLLLIPESPYWCARKGKIERAKKSMRWLYGNVPSYDIEEEYKIMEENALRERELSTGTFNLKEYLERRLLISFLPLAFQQFTGIALFFGFSVYFFQLAGYAKPFEAGVIQSCILLAFIIISFFVIDKLGRRPLLLGGGLVMAVCSLAVGGIGFSATLPGTALVALTCIWTASYAISAGPLGWSYVAETATPRLRAKTTGIAASGTCMFGLIFNYTVPIMLSAQQANWGLKIGLFFGGLNVCGLVLLFFTVPETKGRTFAELDEIFAAKVPTRQFRKYVTTTQQAIDEKNLTV